MFFKKMGQGGFGSTEVIFVVGGFAFVAIVVVAVISILQFISKF